MISLLPVEVQSLLPFTSIEPSELLSKEEFDVLAYTWGYIVRNIREKMYAICIEKAVAAQVEQEDENVAFISVKSMMVLQLV